MNYPQHAKQKLELPEMLHVRHYKACVARRDIGGCNCRGCAFYRARRQPLRVPPASAVEAPEQKRRNA